MAPGGVLVVASSGTMAGTLGPFTGQLPDDGGALELWNAVGGAIRPSPANSVM